MMNAEKLIVAEIKATEAKFKNGKKYSYSFLAMVAARDWAGVENLYPRLDFNGFWLGCEEDKDALRQMAAEDGYEITQW